MQCEVCGRQIYGKPFKAMIEGAKMSVCNKCARLGSAYWEEKPQPTHTNLKIAKPLTRTSPIRKRPSSPINQVLELVDDFALRIRQTREKVGFSHEDLGRKIGEKVSVLRKIESGKMTPDNKLAEKLEHTLRIKLLVPSSDHKVTSVILLQPHEITLGEIAQLKKKEVQKERKPS